MKVEHDAMPYLDDAQRYYYAHLLQDFGEPKGCSDRQIQTISQKFGHKLPAAYQEFLRWMGDDTKGALRGSDWFARDIMDNTEYVRELLEENHIQWRPRSDILAFFCHQGYMIAWFDLPAISDDPLCYFFSEGKQMKQPEQRERFSGFLLCELKGVAEARRA